MTRVTHGQAFKGKRTKLYKAWENMITRAKSDRYTSQGRGVCEEWSASFEAFARHIGPPPVGKFSVDRINNDRGYEPGNVRWATAQDQLRNTKLYSTNKTGVKGVIWDKARGSFRAGITVDYKEVFLGRFGTLEEARSARESGEKRFW